MRRQAAIKAATPGLLQPAGGKEPGRRRVLSAPEAAARGARNLGSPGAPVTPGSLLKGRGPFALQGDIYPLRSQTPFLGRC